MYLALPLVIIYLKAFHFLFCHVFLLNVPDCELKAIKYLEFKSLHRTMLVRTSLTSFRKCMLTTMKKHFTNRRNAEPEKSIKRRRLSSRSDEHETCHQTSSSPLLPGNKFQIGEYLI
jgi:quinol-cytochrome oxidoreductase complex cytochrome b subunit